MAGYKNSVFYDTPISFWTFDLDVESLHNGNIIDEIGSANPGLMAGDNYTLENVSLNDLEVNDQYCIKFAPLGKKDGVWSNTLMEVQHTSDYIFNSFSIEFFFYKASPSTIRNSGEPGQYQTITSPIIKKGSTIQIYMQDQYGGSFNGLVFSMFNGARSVSHDSSTVTPLWNMVNHCVATYEQVQVDLGEYQTIMKLYVNGRLLGTNTESYFDDPPNLNVADPWRIGGNGGNSAISDYQTELLALDQLAVYNYAFTPEQVSNHYRKSKRYHEILITDVPSHYWRMNDLPTPSNNYMYSSLSGGITGRYYDYYVNDVAGPERILDSKATSFNNEGSAGATKYSSGNPIPFMNISSNYSVEFWFSTGYNYRGALFSCYEENPEWKGLNIFINSSDGAESVGSIQISESKTRHINISGNYSDGEWHHFVLVRSGNYLIVYLDGNNVATEELPPHSTNGDPSQLHLMGTGPSYLNVPGEMCELAIYTYALQDIQINSRFNFARRYKIFGFTLLEGNGVEAKVRFYDTLTGNKVGETISDYDTGAYTFHPYSDRNLDIVALLPDNNTTRYRVHGPVRPADYDDPHDTV